MPVSTIISADKILVVEQGKIVETGTHQQLLEARGVYFRLYQNQFRGAEEGEAALGLTKRNLV